MIFGTILNLHQLNFTNKMVNNGIL